MQLSFSELEYASKKKVTRRDRFLSEIETMTPWSALEAELEPFYPKGGGRGRPPIGLNRMLRMYIAQQCFGLCDEGIEDALYDSQAIRQFVGIDLSRESAPDATTLLKFRRLLETHGLTQRIFEAINAHLAERGLLLRQGTIVDATLIAAAPSTKNRQKARDPQMHHRPKRQPGLGVVPGQRHCDVSRPLPVQPLQRSPDLFVQVYPFYLIEAAVEVLLEKDVPEAVAGQALVT